MASEATRAVADARACALDRHESLGSSYQFPDGTRKPLAWKLHTGRLSIYHSDQISSQVSQAEAVFRSRQGSFLVLGGKSCGEDGQACTVPALPKASHCLWL